MIVFVIMPLVGAVLAFRSLHLTRTGVRVQAKVVNYEEQKSASDQSQSQDRRPRYRPIVSFADEQGKENTVTLPNTYQRLPVDVNDTIPIIYPRGKPHKAQSARGSSIWFYPFWFCGPAVGIIVVFGSQLLWYKYFG